MNEIALINPYSKFFLSWANEGKRTQGDIQDLGMKLSKEVSDYLQSADEDSQGNVASNVSKISFIGFSLGGLICWQSFPYLAKYKEKMHAFITLSSPHIGYASHESSLVKSSLWIMEKFVEAGSVK